MTVFCLLLRSVPYCKSQTTTGAGKNKYCTFCMPAIFCKIKVIYKTFWCHYTSILGQPVKQFAQILFLFALGLLHTFQFDKNFIYFRDNVAYHSLHSLHTLLQPAMESNQISKIFVSTESAWSLIENLTYDLHSELLVVDIGLDWGRGGSSLTSCFGSLGTLQLSFI